ncbi:DUF4252 domain-containing protein [Parabacteroides sp. OttesenSCG-928-G06]|nr:DUF4252 domain-containing protein [Parabacteroides sp. OttesenSCG-928-G06]
MKKVIVILILLVTASIGYAQKNVNDLFKEFSKIKESEGVKIGKLTMSLAGIFTDTMGVDSIEAYSFDSCANELKEKLAKSVKELKDSSFETMLTSNEEGSRVKILVKIKDEMIRELVIISTGESNALVRIKGKIKPSDIERVTQKHS